MKYLAVKPSQLSGQINIPPSKSMAHRAIICAFLADGKSEIDNVELSEDIISTCKAVEALGGKIEVSESLIPEHRKLIITGKGFVEIKNDSIDCGESGTTARFIIPVSRLTEDTVTITGKRKLVKRPFSAFYPIFEDSKISYKIKNNNLPLTLNGGLKPGSYQIRGDISSQFISGLLLSLPLLNADSIIEITTALQSSAYIDMTINMQKIFGINIIYNKKENKLFIPGCQKYIPQKHSVEGDWSQSAFWLTAGVISGPVVVSGLKRDSMQGDKVIEDIIKSMDGKVYWKNNKVISEKSLLSGIDVDVSQCPDLAPVLAVLGSICNGEMTIYNASRLRLKESDRIKAITTDMTNIGANIKDNGDSILVKGVKELKGGKVEGFNDHRIVMSAAVAAVMCKNNVYMKDYYAVNKSYPSFWEHYKSLGGNIIEQYLG